LKKSYKIVKCPRCGFAKITTASKSARCFNCGYTWQLKSGPILFSSQDLEKAREFLRKLKQNGGLEFKKASDKFLNAGED